MKIYYMLLLFILFCASCKENSTEPISDNSFSLELQVKDINGNALPNVNVSIWSWSKNNFNPSEKKISSSKNIQATTQIRYDLIQKCFVDLSVYNLNGQIKKNLVSDQFEAGAYNLSFDMQETVGTGVYKCKLITSTDSLKKNILFQDSIYVVLWQPDPTVSLVGKTDIEGKIKITDKSLFPFLYILPPIPNTGPDSPEPRGYFTLSDSVSITLSDEMFTKSLVFIKTIKDGTNNYTLNLTSNFSKSKKSNIYHKRTLGYFTVNKLSKPLINWKLYQNYPNPFN